tara:strand:- start:3348 stop:4241 length:894 start_codon:yes stop_codon:yes gene_type:complete
MKVVYGHTDSIYVTIGSIDEAKKVCYELNEYIQGIFPNDLNLPVHPVQLEFEKYFQTLGVGTVMNRNAGMISWKDGVHLSKLEFTMTGFVAKRQNTIKLEKEVQTEAIKMWVNESSQTEITKYSRGKFNKVKSGKVKLEHIVKRQRLKTNRLKVKCPDCRKRYSINTMGNNCDCGTSKAFMTTLEGKRPTFGSGIAGIIWYQQKYGKEIEDSFYFVKVLPTNMENWKHPLTEVVKKVEWVSAPRLEDLKNILENFSIDYQHYSNKVVDKVKPVFLAMEWPMDEISMDERQQTLNEWF